MDDDRLPPPRSAYRAMGRSSAWERLGVGVMDKAGRSLDHDDYSPATYSLVYGAFASLPLFLIWVYIGF